MTASKPAEPRIATALLQVGYIFAGPIVGLAMIHICAPLVRDRTIYAVGVGTLAVAFLGSFRLFGDRAMPASLPLAARLAFRAGFALCTTFLVIGLAGLANGYATPLTTRTAPAVAKRETRQRDPARRTYYLAVRAWPGSRTVTELAAPPAVYASVAAPIVPVDTPPERLAAMPDSTTVELTVGEGRLGLEWLKAVGLGSPKAPVVASENASAPAPQRTNPRRLFWTMGLLIAYLVFDLTKALVTGRANTWLNGTVTREGQPDRFWRYIAGGGAVFALFAGALAWAWFWPASLG